MPTSSDQHGDAKLLHEAHSLCMPPLNAHHEGAQLVAAQGICPCSQRRAWLGHRLKGVPYAEDLMIPHILTCTVQRVACRELCKVSFFLGFLLICKGVGAGSSAACTAGDRVE